MGVLIVSDGVLSEGFLGIEEAAQVLEEYHDLGPRPWCTAPATVARRMTSRCF